MSAFTNIVKTLRQELVDLLGGTYTIVGPNTGFDPATHTGDIWIEMENLPVETISGWKGLVGGMDENQGIFQATIFNKDLGGGDGEVLEIADIIGSRFRHGFTITHFEEVFIDNTSTSNARIEGPFLQLDVSIGWISYVDR